MNQCYGKSGIRMDSVKIVTDSASEIPRERAEELGITVVPVHIHIGSKVYRDGVDISKGDFYRLVARAEAPPYISAPTPEEFAAVYSRLSRDKENILSIHTSSKLSETYRSALTAATEFIGRNEIVVIDSGLISYGLEILVTAAAEAAARGMAMDDLVRMLRGMIPHIYVVFFVENMSYLERGGWLYRARTALGMPGIRPLLILEEGEIQPLDRVRTRGRAVDRLFEFVAEFVRLEQITILQGHITEEANMLAERINEIYPERVIDIRTYGPVLATQLGPEAIGVIVYEGLPQ